MTEHPLRRIQFVSDALVEQIVEGRKTASVAGLDEIDVAEDEYNDALVVGAHYGVYDSSLRMRARIRIVGMELCRWDEIPERLWRGETNESAAEFQSDHESYFEHPDPDFEFVAYYFALDEREIRREGDEEELPSSRGWTSGGALEAARAYQSACVLVAAAELDVVSALARGPMNAVELARFVRGDERATTILVDAMTAMGLLTKHGERYSAPRDVAELLTEGAPASILPMLRHQANCLRSWAQLAAVVRSGRRYERPASVRGADGDRTAFIEAMEVASHEVASKVVAGLGSLSFDHLLDVGGGPGTWTGAFLRANRRARATLYDLPEVVPIARRHMERAGLGARVSFVQGDFTVDESLPGGVDLVWISAIAHQNSRQQNRDLFAKAYRALLPGGRILVRDIVMDDTRTSPSPGAMFAVNMLVNTDGGRTYSLEETAEDLRVAGFGEPELIRGPRDMDSVLRATKA